jgi:hypothetical protein
MEAQTHWFPARGCRVFGRSAAVGALLAALSACPLVDGQAAPTEPELKAAFLYHFTQFVQWPESAFASATAPFIIGVLAPDPFGPLLPELVRGESVGRHPIEVRDLSDSAGERDCAILFVPRGSEVALDLAGIRNLPVLTVGETQSFFDAGGIILLATERRRIRVRVNLGAARSHLLSISAKLLRVSDVVEATPVSDDGEPGNILAFGRPADAEPGGQSIGSAGPWVRGSWRIAPKPALPQGQ